MHQAIETLVYFVASTNSKKHTSNILQYIERYKTQFDIKTVFIALLQHPAPHHCLNWFKQNIIDASQQSLSKLLGENYIYQLPLELLAPLLELDVTWKPIDYLLIYIQCHYTELEDSSKIVALKHSLESTIEQLSNKTLKDYFTLIQKIMNNSNVNEIEGYFQHYCQINSAEKLHRFISGYDNILLKAAMCLSQADTVFCLLKNGAVLNALSIEEQTQCEQMLYQIESNSSTNKLANKFIDITKPT